MSQITISIRMDENLKKNFASFCEKTGMTMSTAFNMFARSTVRNQAIPFSITTKKQETLNDPFWSAENQSRLHESIKEMETTGGKIRDFDYA